MRRRRRRRRIYDRPLSSMLSGQTSSGRISSGSERQLAMALQNTGPSFDPSVGPYFDLPNKLQEMSGKNLVLRRIKDPNYTNAMLKADRLNRTNTLSGENALSNSINQQSIFGDNYGRRVSLANTLKTKGLSEDELSDEDLALLEYYKGG